MPSAGGQLPRQIVAPASASALAMAKPKPPSSETPATRARLPVRSIDEHVRGPRMRVLAGNCSAGSLRPQHLQRRPPEHLAAVGQPDRDRQRHHRRGEPGERARAAARTCPRTRTAPAPSAAPMRAASRPPARRARRATGTPPARCGAAARGSRPACGAARPRGSAGSRLVASAPTSTSVPVARVNSAMKRMASTTRSTSRSSASCTEREVDAGDVGQPLGERALERAARRGVARSA